MVKVDWGESVPILSSVRIFVEDDDFFNPFAFVERNKKGSVRLTRVQ